LSIPRRNYFQTRFGQSPVAIWDEDFSSLKQLLDDIVSSGVENVRQHFESDPDLLIEAIRRIKIAWKFDRKAAFQKLGYNCKYFKRSDLVCLTRSECRFNTPTIVRLITNIAVEGLTALGVHRVRRARRSTPKPRDE
jgi:hypothetical protein